MPDPVAWLERHQAAVCLAALGVGAWVGLTWPGSPHLAAAVEPVLALLLFATFLAVPFRALAAGLKDLRFLATLGAVTMLAAPTAAWAVTRPLAADDALLLGAVLVLVCPCVDYVITFTGLAGGARDRLLACSPALMLGQGLLLPVWLALAVGPQAADAIDPAPSSGRSA